MQMKEEDTWKTSFKTRQGLYEQLVMPFVYVMHPFIRLMNDVVHPFIESFVMIYLDYMLIFSTTWEEHVSHLKQVLEELKKHQLLETLNKIELAKQSFVYLPHVIGGGELKIDPVKIEAINKWTTPTNKDEKLHWGRTIFEETHYIIFYNCCSTSRSQCKWVEFSLGKTSTEVF